VAEKKYNSSEQDKYTHELYISLDIPTAKTVLAGLLTTCRGTMGTKNKMHFFFLDFVQLRDGVPKIDLITLKKIIFHLTNWTVNNRKNYRIFFI
jgi:hypothetical protein